MYVKSIQNIYDETRMQVKRGCEMEDLQWKLVFTRGRLLSQYLFSFVMELTKII